MTLMPQKERLALLIGLRALLETYQTAGVLSEGEALRMFLVLRDAHRGATNELTIQRLMSESL